MLKRVVKHSYDITKETMRRAIELSQEADLTQNVLNEYIGLVKGKEIWLQQEVHRKMSQLVEKSQGLDEFTINLLLYSYLRCSYQAQSHYNHLFNQFCLIDKPKNIINYSKVVYLLYRLPIKLDTDQIYQIKHKIQLDDNIQDYVGNILYSIAQMKIPNKDKLPWLQDYSNYVLQRLNKLNPKSRSFTMFSYAKVPVSESEQVIKQAIDVIPIQNKENTELALTTNALSLYPIEGDENIFKQVEIEIFKRDQFDHRQIVTMCHAFSKRQYGDLKLYEYFFNYFKQYKHQLTKTQKGYIIYSILRQSELPESMKQQAQEELNLIDGKLHKKLNNSIKYWSNKVVK